MPGPPVTVAVVSFDTRDLLVRCLRSLERDVQDGRADVWVVDNGSRDGSAQAARDAAPWATVIEAPGNPGFGGAVDLVAEATESRWLAPANADIALHPGALEALIRGGGDERTAVVAPRLVAPDGRTQHSVHPFPTVPFTLAFNLGIPRLSARLSERLFLEGHFQPGRPRVVHWAVGAFLLVRRAAFEEVGGFDAEQWMYAEDLDLGWRMARAGWLTRYDPRAVVTHHESAATEVAFGDDQRARFMAATYAVIARRRGRIRAWTTLIFNCLGAGARIAWLTPLARPGSRWAAAREDNRRWLDAHQRGASALRRRR